jgi:transposase-like protein
MTSDFRDPHQACEEGTERDKALCVTLGVRADGAREILGL